MKKFASAALALTLVVSMGGSALAAGTRVIAPNPKASTAITVNGTALDLSKTPAAETEKALPMRALVEADYGFAAWYQDEGKSFFSMEGFQIYVNCTTGAVEQDGKVLPGVKAEFKDGTTFLPASILDGVKGYTVDSKTAGTIAITTPNGVPMVKLVREIMTKAEMGNGMRSTPAEMEEAFGLKQATFPEIVGFFPMMISADTIVVAKVAPGQMDEAKKALKARQDATIKSFEQYLPGPLEVAKNGKIVTSGQYIMLIMSSNNETAIQMFKDGVKTLGEVKK